MRWDEGPCRACGTLESKSKALSLHSALTCFGRDDRLSRLSHSRGRLCHTSPGNYQHKGGTASVRGCCYSGVRGVEGCWSWTSTIPRIRFCSCCENMLLNRSEVITRSRS